MAAYRAGTCVVTEKGEIDLSPLGIDAYDAAERLAEILDPLSALNHRTEIDRLETALRSAERDADRFEEDCEAAKRDLRDAEYEIERLTAEIERLKATPPTDAGETEGRG